MLNIPDWNKDDYDRERDKYPDYDDDEDMTLEDSIQDSIWRGCIEDK